MTPPRSAPPATPPAEVWMVFGPDEDFPAAISLASAEAATGEVAWRHRDGWPALYAAGWRVVRYVPGGGGA